MSESSLHHIFINAFSLLAFVLRGLNGVHFRLQSHKLDDWYKGGLILHFTNHLLVRRVVKLRVLRIIRKVELLLPLKHILVDVLSLNVITQRNSIREQQGCIRSIALFDSGTYT